jgi:hypothetical protein
MRTDKDRADIASNIALILLSIVVLLVLLLFK